MSSNKSRMATRPVFPLLVSLSLPPMISMLIQSLYNIIDSMFVAQIGMDSLTAVSLAFPIQSLIIAFAVGAGVGVNSYISRKLGENNQDAANSAIIHGFILAGILSISFVIIGLFIIEPFFNMFTDNPVILQDAIEYTQVVIIFSFASIFHIMIEKIFQSTGKMIFPTVIQIIGAVTNIILDPIMIFGLFGFPALGIRGAAIATVIGQGVSMLISFYVLLRKDHDVWVDVKNFKYDKDLMKEVVSIGIPNTMMNALPSFLNMGLNGILVSFSNAAVSVLGVYFKLQTFVFMPASGLSQGAMPLMGFSYGAKLKDRLNETMKYNVLVTFVIMIIGVAIFNIFPRQLLLIFNADQSMMEIGVSAIRIVSLSFIPATIGYSVPTLFQAMGKGKESLVIFVLRQFIITLPLSYLLSKSFGLNGIWVSFIVAETIAAFTAYAFWNKLRKTDDLLKI